MTIIGQRTCRGCGCTDSHACPGGCSWVLLDLPTPTGVCSACAEDLGWEPMALAMVGTEELVNAEARAILRESYA